MFKWACLAVAGSFAVVVGWMVNDIRLRVRQSLVAVDSAGRTVDENLPALLERSRRTADTLSERLPEVIDRVQKTTEVLAELSEDLNQLKELAGLAHTSRDKNLVAYADGLMRSVESSAGVIGVRKSVGHGLKNTLPAREWAVAARKEALFLTLLVRSRKEMATRLAKTKLGFSWYLQEGAGEPVALLDWLKTHHAETCEAFEPARE